MDSLTQIVLGAAVGEAVLGKKVGNRAMIWGAVAGTIPDLDILANPFISDIDALAFHRGASHSLLFAVITPFFFAYLVDKFYQSGLYQNRIYKGLMMGFMGVLCLLFIGVLNFVVNVATGGISAIAVVLTLGIGGLLMRWLWRSFYQPDLSMPIATRTEWTWLFFWSIVTHPILDSFTAYGTQLFYPFSDYRVAFNNIAVADPLYTVPFLTCLIIASLYNRMDSKRRFFNYLGIGISSAYMLFTIYNKVQIDKVFEASLKHHNIPYERFTAVPTIFNNVLWNGIAETPTHYYRALYSNFDKSPIIQEFQKLEKGHELLGTYKDDESIKTLQWFSNGYYNIIDNKKKGYLQLNDLRYGGMGTKLEKPSDYVFKFLLIPENGKYRIKEVRGAEEMEGNAFSVLWERIKGI